VALGELLAAAPEVMWVNVFTPRVHVDEALDSLALLKANV
jgi:hypothetical protein